MKRIGKQRVFKKFVKERRKRNKKSDKDCELNVFYDSLRFKNDFSVTQQRLHTVIVIGQSEITSLDVIAELNNLKELWIVECNLQDVTSLDKNESLEKLYLYSNAIEELPDLSNMKLLKVLSLARNSISDLAGLRGAISLRDLNVADNAIHKIIKVFSSKCELSHINLSGNPINDFQDIEDLFSLRSLRSIEFNDPVYGKCPLIDTYFNYRQFLVRRLPNLREIDYYPIGQEEKDDSQKHADFYFSDEKYRVELHIRKSFISSLYCRMEISFDAKVLQKCLNNRSLGLRFFSRVFDSNEFFHIKYLRIVECSILQENLADIFLPQLESLDLSKNLLESMQGLRGMKKLHTLCVSQNKIGIREKKVAKTSNLEKSEFPSMKIFYGDNNEMRSIEDAALPKMPSLKYIFLQNNRIDDINGLQDFPRLITAVLDNNKIEKILKNSFQRNNCLKTLFLEDNCLTDLKFTKNLDKIEKLFLACNKIEDKNELVHLSKLTKLSELTILGNPFLCQSSSYEELKEIIKSIKMIDGNSM